MPVGQSANSSDFRTGGTFSPCSETRLEPSIRGVNSFVGSPMKTAVVTLIPHSPRHIIDFPEAIRRVGALAKRQASLVYLARSTFRYAKSFPRRFGAFNAPPELQLASPYEMYWKMPFGGFV